MPSEQSCRYCFTLNNYSKQEEDLIRFGYDQGFFSYVLYGYEVAPTTGTPHLQGYFETYKKQTKTACHRYIPRGSFFSANGEQHHSYTYCTKQSKPVEYGIPHKQGQRHDLVRYYSYIKEGHTLQEIREEFPTQYILYPKITEKMHKDIRDEKLKKELLLEDYENVIWKDWQNEILKLVLHTKPDARSVHWFWEPNGNVGKSFLTTYLLLRNKAYVVEGGKRADIFFGYDMQPIVIFDLPRELDSESGMYIYGTIECFKNGRFLSSKYETTMKLFRKPHVIVFANFKPNNDAPLSLDRWNIKRLHSPLPDDDKEPDIMGDFDEDGDDLTQLVED